MSYTRYLVTPAGGELVPALHVSQGANATPPQSVPKYVVFSLPITLERDEIVHVCAEVQATNDLVPNCNVLFDMQVLLSTTAAATTGQAITQRGGVNITPDMHHFSASKSGMYQVTPSDIGLRYVNLVAWAIASGAAADQSSLLTIDNSYGVMSYLIDGPWA